MRAVALCIVVFGFMTSIYIYRLNDNFFASFQPALHAVGLAVLSLLIHSRASKFEKTLLFPSDGRNKLRVAVLMTPLLIVASMVAAALGVTLYQVSNGYPVTEYGGFPLVLWMNFLVPVAILFGAMLVWLMNKRYTK